MCILVLSNFIFHTPPERPDVSSGYYSDSSLTLTHRNRCIECPVASKTIRNQLPVKKYIGAVLRKSSQLELVDEIDPLENALSAQKKQRNYIEKSSLKKNKTIFLMLKSNNVLTQRT